MMCSLMDPEVYCRLGSYRPQNRAARAELVQSPFPAGISLSAAVELSVRARLERAMAGAVLERIRDYRPHWLPYLAVSWGLLQVGDIVTTYWGLSFPSIMEANPKNSPGPG